MMRVIFVMTDPAEADKVDKGDISRENIFQIMDGIITQLNKTKKMFIIMILTIMIIPPIAFALTFALFGSPFHFNEDRGFAEGFDDSPHIPPQVALARIIPILVSLVWLGIGIRQWFVLSKWSKKYERYKELQKRIDAKLDYGNNHVEDKREGQ
jgi:NADH:ubiquinone oxidoreductase subunit 5 (subunit L)/multisubunit Na+/H+ antiporter MnhA subunit